MKNRLGKNNSNWKGGKSKCICVICGKKFYTYLNKDHKGKYCSKECYYETYKGERNRFYKGDRKIIKKCKWCNKEFKSYKYRNAKFCSPRCVTMYTLKYRIKTKDTDIEKIIENWLMLNNINYEKQKSISNFTVVDFFIYPDWCLYCDGEYWHSKPERIKKDLEINKKLKEMGYFVQRLSSSAIYSNKEFFNDKIKTI